jgi:hypothetical protein
MLVPFFARCGFCADSSIRQRDLSLSSTFRSQRFVDDNITVVESFVEEFSAQRARKKKVHQRNEVSHRERLIEHVHWF